MNNLANGANGANVFNNMIIKKTNVWGNFHNIKNVDKRIRLIKKHKLITGMEGYPFVDHYAIYACKPKNQKGPAREEQTFILSYAYNYDSFEDENAFINKLNEMGLLFHKEKCLYNNHDAYKIIIYENECPVDVILQQT